MTDSRQVLVLGVYPCMTPRHGGQVRLAEIIAAYRRAGFSVQNINLYDLSAATGQRMGPHDFAYPRDTPWRAWDGKAIPLVDDLTSGRYAANDADAYERITRAVRGAPAVIHLEQPWLLPLVQRWKQEGRFGAAKLVYGSQNIEAPLKQAILAHYGIAEAGAVADDIDRLERQASQEADLVLAVSASDQAQLSAMAGKPVVLAANGIAAWKASPEAVASWRRRLPSTPFALFVGSAHPPNISGFFQSLGDSLGFLPPDRTICIAGSVGPQIVEHPEFRRWAPLNQSRVQVLGLLDDDALAAVKTLAHLFILPIHEGGGSNIKTAEALYSGKHVLGTPVGFRGFDDYLAMPGVHRAETPAAFRTQLRALLDAPALPADLGWQAQRQKLLWQHTLEPMTRAVRVWPDDTAPREEHRS
jgi:glycosyltransferase involved in cell wall biosynthesis